MGVLPCEASAYMNSGVDRWNFGPDGAVGYYEACGEEMEESKKGNINQASSSKMCHLVGLLAPHS